MRHQPGVERARLAAGEADNRLNLPSARVCGRLTRSIADDEMTLVVVSGKAPCAARASRKGLDLGLGALPGRRSVCSSSTQRVPCSMLAATNSASRRAGRYLQSEAPPPAPRVRGLRPVRRAAPHRQQGIHARLRSRARSASDTATAGRNPGRRTASSLSAALHTGQVSSERAIHAAAAPHEAKVSNRPRSRSKACTRG